MFFVIPVGVDYRASRYPVVTFTLIGINVAIFLVLFVLGIASEEGRLWELTHLWLIPADAYPHAYLTSAFMHAGFLHLIGNMMYLFLFGACVEDHIGRLRFLFFYLGGILSSSILYALLTGSGPASAVPMGGASGAVSACIGGFLLLFPRTKVEFKWVFYAFVRVWSGEWYIPAWIPISLWFLDDLLGAVLATMEQSASGGIAFAAHVGGTLAGMAMVGAYKIWCTAETEALKPMAAKRSQIVLRPMDDVAEIYLFLNENQAGPYSRSSVKRMLESGSIGSDTLYWKDGMPEWLPLSELR